jgi:carbon-monoxide dehydrogenase medium subunit
MKAASFDYHAPKSLAEAVALLGRLEDARLIAGGQSLAPMLNMRFVVTDNLVDLNGIPELSYIRESGTDIAIGAMTRQRALLESDLLARQAPIIAEAAPWIGHIQTRSRGPIGGSLCLLDPAAELPVIAALYDAVLTVEDAARREIAIADWPAGYMTPALGAGEILTEIRFEPWSPGHGWCFMELARRHGDFAIVCVGVLLEGSAASLTRARIALGGVDIKPVRLREAEAAIAGCPPTEETFQRAAAFADRIEAMDDAYAGGDYRRRLAAVLVRRALARAATRLGRSS